MTQQIQPGNWLGVLGGGQLARMFSAAAQSMGFRVCVLDPAADSPAGAVADQLICSDYNDERALRELAERCAAATTEFENVPASSLDFLAQRIDVSPSGASVAIAQDRIAEKKFIAACGVPVVPHAVIINEQDVAAVDPALLPGILKSARLGYDGKGQSIVTQQSALLAAWKNLGAVPCVLEQKLDLAQEISIVVARGRDGATVSFPVAENQHRDGILAVSIIPARTELQLTEQARGAAFSIAAAMQYTGVLCVEFFVLRDGRLLVNEIAPRPHNSGHYSIEACITSQFEQQVRTMAGLPLGNVTQLAPAVMLNILGDIWFDEQSNSATLRDPHWSEVLAVAGAKLHLYGKSEPRRGRKMGHVTCLGSTLAEALARACQVAAILDIAPPR